MWNLCFTFCFHFYRFVKGEEPIQGIDDVYVPCFLRSSLSESFSTLYNYEPGALEQGTPIGKMNHEENGSDTLRKAAVLLSGGEERYNCAAHLLKVSKVLGRDPDLSVFPKKQKKSEPEVVTLDD